MGLKDDLLEVVVVVGTITEGLEGGDW